MQQKIKPFKKDTYHTGVMYSLYKISLKQIPRETAMHVKRILSLELFELYSIIRNNTSDVLTIQLGAFQL